MLLLGTGRNVGRILRLLGLLECSEASGVTSNRMGLPSPANPLARKNTKLASR